MTCIHSLGLLWWVSSQEPACGAGDTNSLPEWGRCPAGGHGNPLQHSCLENPGTEETGVLWIIGLQRDGHNSSELAHMCTFLKHSAMKGHGIY